MNRSVPLDQPLRLAPSHRTRVWGGWRLAEFLDQDLGSGEPIGESWLLYDRPEGSSLVADGAWAGWTLEQLLAERGPELLGEGVDLNSDGRFPLLIKLLDARGQLSVQVHPGSGEARAHGDQGKAEAWVVLDADPAGRVYRGLEARLGRSELASLAREGGLSARLRSFSVGRGDVVWIPPGTIHAMGGGLLLYEVQQNSDLTFRLYDWDRPGLDGRPRELHMTQALDAACLDGAGETLHPVLPLDGVRTLLVECPRFVLERWTLPGPVELPAEGRCRVLTVTDGAVMVGRSLLGKGETALVPAPAGCLTLVPSGAGAELLVARPPVRA